MLNEGKLSDKAARILALAIKRKTIGIGRAVKDAENSEEKLDLISRQVSALSALILVGISVGGDGLLSKAGIVSGLFTEESESLPKNEKLK